MTGLMLLSAIYLLLWDVKSFQIIFKNEGVLNNRPLKIADNFYWTWLGILIFVTTVPLTVMKAHMLVTLGIVGLEGVLGVMVFFLVRINFKRVVSR